MTYEEIKKINASLKPMDIKGKKYIPVNERVKAFRILVPDGTIETELINSGDYIIFKAKIFVNGDLKATGYAEEIRGSSSINRTSALENAETSAVGRALGFIGIGIDTSIASFEEVNNAQMFNEANKLATPTEKAGLIATARARGIEVEELLKMVGFDREKQPEGMTAKQYGKAMNILNGGI